jgi:hypothetical protein
MSLTIQYIIVSEDDMNCELSLCGNSLVLTIKSLRGKHVPAGPIYFLFSVVVTPLPLFTPLYSSLTNTAIQRTNAENLKQIFPEKEIARPQSQFPHSCVCERCIIVYIPTRSICLFFCRKICGPIL